MIKSSIIHAILPVSLAFSILNGMDSTQGMRRDSQYENKLADSSSIHSEDVEECERTHIISISSKSIQDWASLWENEIYPLQMKDLDLTLAQNLSLFDVWLFAFHYWNYKQNIPNNSELYINILKDARIKSLNEITDEYTLKYLEFLLGEVNVSH